MFCRHCGTQLPEDAKFCSACGQSQDASPVQQIVADPYPVFVNQEEAFTLNSSHRLKKLSKNAWITYIICALFSLLIGVYILFFQTGKISTEGLYINGEEIVAEKIVTLDFAQTMELMQEELPQDVYAVFVAILCLLIVLEIVTFIMGFLACKKKRVGLAIAYLLMSFFFSLTKIFHLIAAICILVFVCKINNECKTFPKRP